MTIVNLFTLHVNAKAITYIFWIGIRIVLIMLTNAFKDCKQLQVLEFLQEKCELMKAIYHNSRMFIKEYWKCLLLEIRMLTHFVGHDTYICILEKQLSMCCQHAESEKVTVNSKYYREERACMCSYFDNVQISHNIKTGSPSHGLGNIQLIACIRTS